jgi:hypothetical protein
VWNADESALLPKNPITTMGAEAANLSVCSTVVSTWYGSFVRSSRNFLMEEMERSPVRQREQEVM